MLSSHLGQMLVISGGQERRYQTGLERELAKYTFSVKMPVTGEIIKTIYRYRATADSQSIAEWPQAIILYEDIETKQIGMIDITKYCSHHEYFGFEYEFKTKLSALRPGKIVEGGTVILDSPAVKETGGYAYGINANIAYMSMPGVAEDGIVIRRGFLKSLSYKTYETRVVEWGNKHYPINLYPNARGEYRPGPDIGDYVRDDGLLNCLRSYDKHLAPIEQNLYALQEPDLQFDKPTYAPAGGKIIDIRVHHDPNSAQVTTPEGMEEQLAKYDRGTRVFYEEILQVYYQLKKQRGVVNLTPELHRMIVEALAYVKNNSDQRIAKLFRRNPLDDWRVEYVIEYDNVPNIGNKLTDLHGGKGVICTVVDDEHMPRDADGNVADVVMDGNSTISRMNVGRKYEQFFNGTARDTINNIKKTVGFTQGMDALSFLKNLEENNAEMFNRVWSHLMGLYELVVPHMASWFNNNQYQKPRHFHLAQAFENGHHMFYPTDNQIIPHEVVQKCRRLYPSTYGPVTYVGNSGKTRVTKENVRIAEVYMIELEKTGDDWTGVSSGKLQHFGVLATVSNSDKHSQPTRTNPIRALGEAELRIYTAYVGPRASADIMDRNNNPAARRQIVNALLNAPKPTDIQLAVDRTLIPMGGSKPMQLIKHFGECAGWEFTYERKNPIEYARL